MPTTKNPHNELIFNDFQKKYRSTGGNFLMTFFDLRDLRIGKHWGESPNLRGWEASTE
jgi:hypothetical protein